MLSKILARRYGSHALHYFYKEQCPYLLSYEVSESKANKKTCFQPNQETFFQPNPNQELCFQPNLNHDHVFVLCRGDLRRINTQKH